MTDKTDLIEQIKLHVGFMKDCDNWVSDDHHSNVIKKLCIESDDAREYWEKRTVEQACEAVRVK